MISTALLLVQVVHERYARTVLQTTGIILGVTIYFVALAVIFTWMGVQVEAE